MNKMKKGVAATLLAATLGGCGGGSGSDSKLNEAVKTVLVVGTSVTGQIYVDGGYGITLVPLDEAGKAVLGEGLDVSIDIEAPTGYTSAVNENNCMTADPGAGLAVGVIIDDSGSMSSSDPSLQRKAAAVAFIDTI